MPKVFQDIPFWLGVAAYLLASIFAALFTRNALKRWLARVGPDTDTHLREVLSRSLPKPAGAAVFFFALSAGLRFFPLPARAASLTRNLLPFFFGTLAVVLLMRLALSAITAYGDNNPALKSTASIGRAITYIVGGAIIAVLVSDAVGVSLAPALTALGVGSLSVALALQDTLSNFFAGIYLLLDKPIRPGDFIRLDSGQEGYVEEIGWRSTHLRTRAPSQVIVPNATLSKAIIVNFEGTNPRLLLKTRIDLAIDADLERAQAVLDEVAKSSSSLPGVERGKTPFVRFDVGDRGLSYTLYCTIAPSADDELVQQELRRRAVEGLRKVGVQLADPNPFARRS